MLINNVKAELIKSFNRTNKLQPSLQLSEVVWLNVEIFIDGDCNSRTTIVINNSSYNFEGTRVLSFSRRDISADLKGLKIPGKRSDYTTLRTVIKALRDLCGVPVDPSEFLDTALPATGPVTIQPTTICMGYLPGASIDLDFAET